MNDRARVRRKTVQMSMVYLSTDVMEIYFQLLDFSIISVASHSENYRAVDYLANETFLDNVSFLLPTSFFHIF